MFKYLSFGQGSSPLVAALLTLSILKIGSKDALEGADFLIIPVVEFP